SYTNVVRTVMTRTRREYLLTVGITGVTGLAGCASDDSSADGAPDRAADETPSGTSPDTGGAGTTSTPTQAETTTGTETESDTPPPSVPIAEVSGVSTLGYNPGRQNATPDGNGGVSGFEQRWRQVLFPSGSVSQPVVMNGQVYTTGGLENESPVRVRSTSGEELWTFAPEAGGAGLPTVVDETVVVGTTGDDTASAVGGVYGLDPANGSERWTIETGDYNTGLVTAAVDGVLYFTGTRMNGDGSNALYAYSIDGREQLWETELEDEPDRVPVVSGSTIAVKSGNSIIGVNRATGEVRWSVPELLGGGLRSPHSIATDDGYIGLQDQHGLVEVTASDGSTRQIADMEAVPQAVSGEYVIAASMENGTVIAISTSDGAVRWEKDLEFRFPSCAIAGETVYAAGDKPVESGKIVALSLADGSERARTGFPASAGTPVVADGYVFVPVGNTLFALEEN
ncbi:MAG: PQQ-binding-like beta-propeller repeat protein, partial [Haloarculaceae archaeon]